MVALALVTLVDAVDISILRGVLPLIKDDWDLSDLQLGLLGFAFIFVNIIAAIPAGWMADRYRRTRIIGLTMLTWSAFSALAAASVNYANLFAARAALGMGQAMDDPSSTALLADYYPARLRGRVFSIQQVTQFIGAGIGLGVGGAVGAALGWRWAFLLVGTPGAIVVALLVFRLRETVRGEAEHIEAFGTPPPEPERRAPRSVGIGRFLSEAAREINTEMRAIFRIRTMRYLLVGISVLLFTVTGIGYWLAVYHQRYSGMTVTVATGATAAVLGLGGIVGTVWGGRVTDRIYGRGPAGRITMVGGTIIGSLGLFVLSFNIPLVPARFVLQLFGILVGAAAFPGLRASMVDVVPAESRGMGVSAFSLTSALFGTALAPPIVGALSDATSLLAAFNIVSPIVLIGALIVLRARRTIVEDAQAIFDAVMARRAQTSEGDNATGPMPAETAAALDEAVPDDSRSRDEGTPLS
jgi:MFS family permease